MAESQTFEMEVRSEEEPKDKDKPKLSAGKIFYKPGVIEEETDETSAYDSSMVETPMLGSPAGGPMLSGLMSSGYLRPPLTIHPSSSLHRIPTYASSIGQSTVYRPDSCRSRSHRHGVTRRTRRRAILKNGDCNILKSKISQRRLRFLQDMFTTLVDAQWRWTLLVFTLSFILSWLGFALIWWLIAFTHGDLEENHLPPMQDSSGWNPCVLNIHDFTSCFLFSIETQHTIGYGARTTTEECPEAIFIMCLQSIVGVMIQAFMVGIVFAKMTRPKHRTQTLLFSKYAVVCQRDSELCLMFRVGDLRKSHIIGACVRAQLIRSRTTKEGELLSHYQTELQLNADGCDSNLFFIWPITMVHRINAESPFYGISAADVLQERFEIVVVLEGTIESTGQTTQARSSYTNSEIMWGHRFVPLVTYNRERQGYEVDYSKFEETTQVDTPLCSAKELDEFYGNNPDHRSIESGEHTQTKLQERPPTTEPKAEHRDGDYTVVLQEFYDSQRMPIRVAPLSKQHKHAADHQIRTMRTDPESPAYPEEAQPLHDNWPKTKIATTNDNLFTDVYRPTVTNKGYVEPQNRVSSIVKSKANFSNRYGDTRKNTRRAVLKNGECNILQSKIRLRRLRFLQDIFTTLVDCQWRWNLLIFTLSFALSWLGFALIWLLIAFKHGDFEEDHLPPMQESSGWNPCVLGIYDYTSCFLFSIETQHTIGYGARTTTEECPEAIFIMCIQSIVGVLIQGFFGGVVVAKITRPRQRTQTLLFSQYAVVCQRDSELCLMFRVGDMQKSNIIGASVRALLIRSRTTKEGELLPHYQTELELNADGCDSNLFFIWPLTMVHTINTESPFYGMSAADMLQETFEIVVVLDGTEESTAQTIQARSSYTNSEVIWGYRFVPVITFNRERQGYEVDFSKFEETKKVETPLCSAKELVNYYSDKSDCRPIESERPQTKMQSPPTSEPKVDHRNGDCAVTL